MNVSSKKDQVCMCLCACFVLITYIFPVMTRVILWQLVQLWIPIYCYKFLTCENSKKLQVTSRATSIIILGEECELEKHTEF